MIYIYNCLPRALVSRINIQKKSAVKKKISIRLDNTLFNYIKTTKYHIDAETVYLIKTLMRIDRSGIRIK